jgi:hypothetical protein
VAQYKAQLIELQKMIEKLRVGLILQKTTLESSSAQLSAASQWCEAFQQTR